MGEDYIPSTDPSLPAAPSDNVDGHLSAVGDPDDVDDLSLDDDAALRANPDAREDDNGEVASSDESDDSGHEDVSGPAEDGDSNAWGRWFDNEDDAALDMDEMDDVDNSEDEDFEDEDEE